MPKRSVYLVVVGLFAIGGLITLFNRTREPEYAGKKLGEWVEKLDSSAAKGEKNNPARDEAAAAIRHIGTNAFPYLLHWIRYEPPAWRKRINNWARPKLKGMNLSWNFLVDEHYSRTEGAIRAFKEFGQETEAAIPDLGRLMNNPTSPLVAERATSILSSLRARFLSAEIVLTTNNSSTVSLQSIRRLPQWGTNAHRAVPVLRTLLGHSNAEIAAAAARTLNEIEPEALERAAR